MIIIIMIIIIIIIIIIIKYVKNQPTFSEIYKVHGQITQEFLGLRMQNSWGTAFIWA